MIKQRNKINTKDVKYRLWFFLNTFFTCVYLTWRIFFTIPLEYGLISIIAGVSLFIVEFIGMFEATVHFYNMNNVQNKPLPKIPNLNYPEVDIFIATYNEPVELLFKTINGCKYLDYPNKNKVHIYLCDDGHRLEMRNLAEKMGINYLDRPTNEYAKAGNLNNALLKSSSPLLVTFDADMIPRHNFLMRTVPYFVGQEMKNENLNEKDRKHIGFVQTPQAFYNPDLFQFNLFSEKRIPNEQDFFYRDIQLSRNKSNSVIYGGSNTVISRRAIEDIGGFFKDSITEDYATGILIQKKGYICLAVNEVLASGLSPSDLKSLITQRIRWARGVIQTNKKVKIWSSKELTFGQKINYWASKWYWYASIKRLIYYLSPILYAVFGYMVIRCTLWEVLLFWLPMYISSSISLRMLSRNIRTTKWTNIYETVLFPYMIIPVILETLGIQMKEFKVTKKDGAENQKGKNLLYLVPFALLVTLSVIGIIRCFAIIFSSGSMGPIVVLFWLIVNMFTLLMSMFFIIGRSTYRKSERTRAFEDSIIHMNGRDIECITNDISETGISLILDKPIDVKDGEELTLSIITKRYYSKIKAKIVHVDNLKTRWNYAFKITKFVEGYDEYLQIIYDRIPTLPQNLDDSSGSFDDLSINVSKRVRSQFYEKRLSPRVIVNTEVYDDIGRFYRIVDFNYKYFSTVKSHINMPQSMFIKIPCDGDITLECVLERELPNQKFLYKIENYEYIISSSLRQSQLEAWVSKEWNKIKDNLDNLSDYSEMSGDIKEGKSSVNV